MNPARFVLSNHARTHLRGRLPHLTEDDVLDAAPKAAPVGPSGDLGWWYRHPLFIALIAEERDARGLIRVIVTLAPASWAIVRNASAGNYFAKGPAPAS